MLVFIIILFASTFSRSQASTNVGGMLLQNTIWSRSGGANPYYLISNVYVPRNVTLTIQAGVQILFDRGDFEILVKGFLHVQGTASNPVQFYNGAATNTKWMVTLQSTNLSASFVNNAIFTGPQKGLQITTALAGLPQNTGVLVVQNTVFLENTSIESNGNYPFNCYFPLHRSSPAPSLELISAVIKNSLVSTGNTFSESILITNSKIFNTTIRPAAALDGIHYSTIELKAPPLVLGDYSTILCSSVKRSSYIAQENTIGIQASSITIALSSIRSFEVGLEITSNSTQKSSILSSNFISNSVFNIRNVGPYNIEATDNWWGSANSADIQNKIYDYWDNVNSGEVIYSRASNGKLQAEDSCPPYKVYTIIANFTSGA
ncbi:unnamed protein product [Rotaria sordida]|uniref:Uncharacterized protein n=1 Tax=Rotaria sordida TaxID=392033 RepID=A0A815JTT5_9BILA|nr:unnamed protein product [Rotaria sordida]CAF1386571.1 unnamed protein product [Rotaria sordida]